MQASELIVDTSAPGVVQLILNRPEQLNAWTPTLERSVFAALDASASDPQVRVVVITGAGRGFCAGASMNMLGESVRSEDRLDRRRLCELADFPKPVVAAINGPAAGIGFALALWCDVRICAADAKLTTSFARLGLVAEHGTAWLLPRIVGRAHAVDLLLSGRTITGTEALAMGLVQRAVDTDATVTAALEYAQILVESGAPTSWAAIKAQIAAADSVPKDVAYTQSIELMGPALSSEVHREGVQAWRQKRAPRFPPYPDTAGGPIR